MDDEFVERRPGDMETYRRIDAFAHVRLAPNAVAMARIRSTLVAEATIRAAHAADDGATRARSATGRTAPGAVPRRRLTRIASALLAAAMTLGLVAGSVAASAAGGPLYGPRLWLEELTLPGSGIDRGQAQLGRLHARLAELRTALASGNAGGVAAALDAYGLILADLETQAGTDPAVALLVTENVSRHLEVLQALVGHVPPQAQDALQHALDRGDAALDMIGNGKGGRPDPGPGRPANGGPNDDRGSTPDRPDDRGDGATDEGGDGATDERGNGAPDASSPAAPPTRKPARTTSPDPTPTPITTPIPTPTPTPTADTEVAATPTPPATARPAKEPGMAPNPTPDGTARTRPEPRSEPHRTPRSGGNSSVGS